MEEDLSMIGDASETCASPDILEVIAELTPAKQRRVDSWYIQEPDVLSAILSAGYNYIHEGDNWYDADIPIPDEGTFPLPDGRFLYSDGSSLTLLTKEQQQQKALDDFDARLAKRRKK